MKNSIMLPLNYEKIFMVEARKSGLIKHIQIDDGIDTDELDRIEDVLFKKHYRFRQKLFQMILLYDELIIQDFDPTYEYGKIKNMGNFKIYSFDDFYNYDSIHQEEHLLFAEYLKPALLPVIKKELKRMILINDKQLSLNIIASELYDLVLGLRKDISSNVEALLDTNKKNFDMSHQKYMMEMALLNAPAALTEERFYTEIFQIIRVNYESLCWQLEISSKNDSYIVNCDYKLSKIGCENYEKDVNTYLQAYKILKCECSSIIGALPYIESIEEAISLKEKRKNDIKNLRGVLNNLEHVLKEDGRENAILQAVKDVKKASSALSKCNTVSKIGKWTTLFSVPIGVAEMVLGGGFVGLGISGVGTATCLLEEKIKKNNNWCEIVR